MVKSAKVIVHKDLIGNRKLQMKFWLIGCASLVFILRDVTRFAGFARRLVQEVSSLVFDPMLSLWGILVHYK